MFTLNGETFRGSLVVIRDRQSGVIDAVNHIGIEDYLAGVVGAEMPSYWESAALESQTIIARTYCLFISERFGKGRDWDLRRTQANQAYRGLDAENPRIWQAIDKTYGQVLTSQNNILPAYYSSICGGHTEPSENVFGGEVYPALSGVDCPWCVQTARQEYFAWPTFEISKSDVWLKLLNRYPSMAGLGNIFGGIEILSTSGYDDFSRITKIKLVSDTGAEEAIRGEDFRLALDSSGMKIKSSSFEIIDANDSLIFVNGRGFGHGVGLCQYGAQALARNGKKAYEILEFYYPGCEIKSLY